MHCRAVVVMVVFDTAVVGVFAIDGEMIRDLLMEGVNASVLVKPQQQSVVPPLHIGRYKFPYS